MNFKEQQKKFIRELELFLELWKKTKAKDPQDFKNFMEDFKRRIKNQQFITIRDTGDRDALLTISDQIKNDFSQLGEKYGKKIYDILKQGVKEDTSRTLLYDRAMREVRKGKQYAYTWINTAENAINQAQRIRENIEAGVKYFKYAGPPADREFCQHLLDKVYTVEEIEQMDNGQGLPVLYYRGGYNCRHRWQPVNEFASKDRGNEIPIADKNKIVELKPVNITGTVKHNNNNKTNSGEIEKEQSKYFTKTILKNKINEALDIDFNNEFYEVFDGCVSSIVANAQVKGAYCRGTNVHINTKIYNTKNTRKDVAAHEIGHAFVEKYQLIEVIRDIKNAKVVVKGININPIFKAQFDKNYLAVKNNYKKLSGWLGNRKAIYDKYLAKGFTKEEIDSQLNPIFDYFGALTNGSIGGGHTPKYYKKDKGTYAKHEWFANVSSLYFNESKILKDEFPEFYNIIKNSFKEIVDGTKKR